MLLQMAGFHSFYSIVYIHYIFFIHSSVNWTFRLLPYFGHCKQHCSEYLDSCIFLNPFFFPGHVYMPRSEIDCLVI